MSNRVLIDSSILIEYIKSNKVNLFNSLMDDNSLFCYVNETIISEFYFHFLKLNTGKAPATLKSSREIKGVLDANDGYLLFNVFEFLPNDKVLLMTYLLI